MLKNAHVELQHPVAHRRYTNRHSTSDMGLPVDGWQPWLPFAAFARHFA